MIEAQNGNYSDIEEDIAFAFVVLSGHGFLEIIKYLDTLPFTGRTNTYNMALENAADFGYLDVLDHMLERPGVNHHLALTTAAELPSLLGILI